MLRRESPLADFRRWACGTFGAAARERSKSRSAVRARVSASWLPAICAWFAPNFRAHARPSAAIAEHSSLSNAFRRCAERARVQGSPSSTFTEISKKARCACVSLRRAAPRTWRSATCRSNSYIERSVILVALLIGSFIADWRSQRAKSRMRRHEGELRRAIARVVRGFVVGYAVRPLH